MEHTAPSVGVAGNQIDVFKVDILKATVIIIPLILSEISSVDISLCRIIVCFGQTLINTRTYSA